MRTLQYFARFYAWYLLRTNHPATTIAPWSAIKTQFAMIRKAFRLGKFVEHAKAAQQAFDASPKATGMSPLLKYCAVGRQLGYTGYMLLDHIIFFHLAGIRPFSTKEKAKQIQDAANRFWFAGIAFNTIAGVYQLVELRQRAARIDTKEGEGVVEKKTLERQRAAVNLQLLSDVCDITAPSLALGYGGNLLDDGLVGLAGVLSSLIGVYSVWQKTA